MIKSRLFKYDHVVGLDGGSEGTVIGKLMNANANVANTDVSDNPDAVFDIILERMTETYAMYVYCPSDGLGKVVSLLKTPQNLRSIKSSVLAADRADEDSEAVHECVKAFVRAATEIVAGSYMKSRIRSSGPVVDLPTVMQVASSDSGLYESVRHIGKLEASRFSREKNGQGGVQKNVENDRGDKNVINVDDILKSHADLRHAHFASKRSCSKNTVKLQRDDHGLVCNIQNGAAVEKNDNVVNLLRSSVPVTPPRVDDGRASFRNANNLYKASALLLEQARLRLSHGSQEYSNLNKLSLQEDSMSEGYVRFYDRHLTDFVRSSRSDSPVHAFFLGAAVAQVQFRMVRERCDEIVRAECQTRTGKPCSPTFSVSLAKHPGAYAGVYSDEIRMFHLTCRPFVDQFVSAYGRTSRETYLILNDIPSSGQRLTIGDLKKLAGDKYDEYVREAFPKVAVKFKILNRTDIKSSSDTFFNSKGANVAKLEELLDGVDLISLQTQHQFTIPKTDRTKGPKPKPFVVQASGDAGCPFNLSYTPCAEGEDCYEEVDAKRKELVKAIKAFDMSSWKDSMINIANSVMMGHSAVMMQGATMLGFGGSGVGKTSFFFGKSDDIGLVEHLLKSVPKVYPFFTDSNRTLTVSVREITNVGDFFYGPNGRRAEDTNAKISLPETNFQENMTKLIKDVDITRKTNGTIKKTRNNPESSRSVMIYNIEITYTGRSWTKHEIGLNEDENEKTRGDGESCEVCKEKATVTIPITVIDLPGYEMNVDGDTEFINGVVKDSLRWAYSGGDPPERFLDIGNGAAGGSRVMAFVMFNNSSKNETKANLEAAGYNGKKPASVWTQKQVDDMFKQHWKQIIDIGEFAQPTPHMQAEIVRYAILHILANAIVARSLFHKFQEDQRMMFGLIKRVQGDSC